MSEFLIFLPIYFFLGVFAGTMSGLLGIGGGLVVVPGLAYLFEAQHMPAETLMHMAISTSLAVMIITTSRSLRSHLKRHIPFWAIYKQLMPGIIVGATGGAVLAHFLRSNTLGVIFGIVVLLVAVKMLFEGKRPDGHRLPGRIGMASAGVVIGAKSGLLGLGGGTLTIPFLNYCNVSMRKAIVVSSATSLTVAITGSISYAIAGMGIVPMKHWMIGYIYWPAWIVVALGSVLFAPLGVYWSHKLPVLILKRIFAVFLLLVGVHMLFI